jgi:hypothetical protein
MSERRLLTLAGGLLVGGFLAFTAVTVAWHPGGDEDTHPVIFQKYADSDAWVATHFGQFVCVLVALAGFVVLHRTLALRGEVPLLALWAVGTTIATAAVWAVLQAVDGVALKQTVDTWADASGQERTLRFANAETVRWTEWGLQAYFRLLLGATLVLFGVAVARTGIVYRWLGPVAVVGGIAYATVGVAVGHSGLEQPGGPLISLLFLVFMVGVLVAGLRRKDEAGLGPRG